MYLEQNNTYFICRLQILLASTISHIPVSYCLQFAINMLLFVHARWPYRDGRQKISLFLFVKEHRLSLSDRELIEPHSPSLTRVCWRFSLYARHGSEVIDKWKTSARLGRPDETYRHRLFLRTDFSCPSPGRRKSFRLPICIFKFAACDTCDTHKNTLTYSETRAI